MDTLIERVAALDVHKDSVVACVRLPGKGRRRRQEKRTFRTTTEGLLVQLRDSLMPSEREMAADQLARANWKEQPEVVQGLVQAAKYGPAPVVRVAKDADVICGCPPL